MKMNVACPRLSYFCVCEPVCRHQVVLDAVGLTAGRLCAVGWGGNTTWSRIWGRTAVAVLSHTAR